MSVASIGQKITLWARRVPTWVIYTGASAWAAWLFWLGLNGQLGPDPVKALEHTYGLLALQFLIAGLCVTPLMRFARISLVKFRRAIGLMAFLYLTLHFLVWLLLDLQLRWGQIGADLTKRPYIIVGFIAFLLMIPLAVTSADRLIRRMGPVVWRRLHRAVYLIAILGAVHFIMQEKVWTTESLLYLAVVVILIGLRLIPTSRQLSRRSA